MRYVSRGRETERYDVDEKKKRKKRQVDGRSTGVRSTRANRKRDLRHRLRYGLSVHSEHHRQRETRFRDFIPCAFARSNYRNRIATFSIHLDRHSVQIEQIATSNLTRHFRRKIFLAAERTFIAAATCR